MVLDNPTEYIEYIEELREEVKEIKELAFHGPFSELSPASRDQQIREITYRKFTQAYTIVPKTYPPEVWLNNSILFWSEFLIAKMILTYILRMFTKMILI